MTRTIRHLLALGGSVRTETDPEVGERSIATIHVHGHRIYVGGATPSIAARRAIRIMDEEIRREVSP